MARPVTGEHFAYFQKYIDLVPEDDALLAMENQEATIVSFLAGISEEKSMYRYAEDKWTLKEVLQHIIDAERIFSYRALAFARQDPNSIAGFEENAYAAVSEANRRSWADLTAEYLQVRKCTEILFRSFSEKQLSQTGTASDNLIKVNSIGFIIAGHFTHHANVIKERYGV
jgi:DinB superfamily